MLKKKRNKEEEENQKAFFKWLILWDNKIRDYTFAIPNGGSRHIVEAVNLQAMGVTPGVPDVFCAVSAFGFHGLFIEFKSSKGKLTETQQNMCELLSNNCYKVVTCYSWIEAKEIMEWYAKGI